MLGGALLGSLGLIGCSDSRPRVHIAPRSKSVSPAEVVNPENAAGRSPQGHFQYDQ